MILLGPGVDFRPRLHHVGQRPLATVPLPVSEWPARERMLQFLTGGCGVFALALHRLAGWPLCYFPCDSDLCGITNGGDFKMAHVTLWRPDVNLIVDGFGHRTEAMMRASFALPMGKRTMIGAAGLLGSLKQGTRIGPFSEFLMEDALAVCDFYWRFYGYPWLQAAQLPV